MIKDFYNRVFFSFSLLTPPHLAERASWAGSAWLLIYENLNEGNENKEISWTRVRNLFILIQFVYMKYFVHVK